MLALIAVAVLTTRHEVQVTAEGGLSAGLPVAGWAGGSTRYEYDFDSGLFIGARGGLSGGIGMLNPSANFLAGAHVVDTRHFDWDLMLYTGWPLLGVQSTMSLHPLVFEHFVGTVGVRASGEVLFNAEGDVFVRLAVPVRGWVPSVRVAVEAGAGVRSGVHVGPTVALQLTRTFE
jgi:hypothetical protein